MSTNLVSGIFWQAMRWRVRETLLLSLWNPHSIWQEINNKENRWIDGKINT